MLGKCCFLISIKKKVAYNHHHFSIQSFTLLNLDLVPMTAHEALAMILDCGLTKEQYKKIRMNSLKRNACIYPSYQQVLDAKLDCQPPNISTSETLCQVPMQDVLNHQVLFST